MRTSRSTSRACRRLPGETFKPRASPGLHRERSPGSGCIRASRLRGARPASLDAAQGPEWSRRRGAAQRRHRRACSAVRTLRLPQDRRAAAPSRLARQRQAGRADLATRGAEGPQEATQTRTALAYGRIVHPAAARASQPRLVLRLRRGPDAQQTEVRMLNVIDEFTHECLAINGYVESFNARL